MSINEKILTEMIEFEKGCPKRIHHLIKVYEFAHIIAEAEKIEKKDQEILELTAIVHDIGIRPNEEKHGHCTPKMQEEVGPEYARKLFAAYPEVSKEYLDRICFLIAHHHTFNMVDGIDYRILLEADFLVNSYEENMELDAIEAFRDNVFRTKTGISLLNTMFGLE